MVRATDDLDNRQFTRGRSRTRARGGLIEQALPDYFEWFADFREVRNDMKLGASTAFGFRGAVGWTQARVILQNVDDAKRYGSSGRELSLVDMDRCLTQSARLVQIAADYTRIYPAPMKVSET